MNGLIHQLSVLWRALYIVVAMGVLTGMPYLGNRAWSAFQEYRQAGARLESAKATRTALEAKAARIRDYQKFTEEAKGFQSAIRENRLDQGNWTTYEVAIKERLSSVTEMRTFLSNAGPTSRYYFRPKRLEITALSATEHLPAELQKALSNRDNKKNPLAGATRFLGPDDRLPMVGEKVLLSLSGTYLVFSRQ